jgi:hypothetical protein
MGKTAVQERRTKYQPQAQPAQAEAQPAVEAPTCQHHWVIETPRGSLSAGRCKRCGEQREFRNSASDHVWEDESGNSYNPWRGARATPKPADDDEVAASPRSGEGLSV